jgi:hypothetical protein
MYLPMSGWTWKSRKAPVKMLSAKGNMRRREVRRGGGAGRDSKGRKRD